MDAVHLDKKKKKLAQPCHNWLINIRYFLPTLFVEMHNGPVSQSASYWDGSHRTEAWQSSLCCELFGCIMLLARYLFKQSSEPQRTFIDAQPSTPSNRQPHTLQQYGLLTMHCVTERGVELLVSLFVHLDLVCFAKHHSAL